VLDAYNAHHTLLTTSPRRWVEIDPQALLSSVDECCKVVSEQFPRAQLRALGVTNQRETTLVWDRTGRPLYNAITWLDTRTHDLVHQLVAKYGSRDQWRARTGLPITTYFSALKLKWLMDHVPAVKHAVTAGECHFGTVDSWLIWNLTRDTVKQVAPAHVTDVTNASRTLIYNINDQKWDEEICRELDIPLNVLPIVRSSAEIYGHVRTGHAFEGVPIAGVSTRLTPVTVRCALTVAIFSVWAINNQPW
jgi:glycerol kinase